MATKKQKRAKALAKREAYFAQVKAEGLEALRRDRERRAQQRSEWVDQAEETNKRNRNRFAQAVYIGEDTGE